MRTRRPHRCVDLLAMTTNFNVFFILYGSTLLHFTLAVIYTDQWAVHIEDGASLADEIARKHGFVNLGKITTDYYHFQHRRVAKRSVHINHEHHSKLVEEPAVKWAQQQVLRKRVKRDYREIKTYGADLNDPLWPQMWYLNRGNGLDMNVQAAWSQGVTGRGVVVTILDDGLEKDHPDIKLNYDALASYDVNNHDEDPQPRYDFVDSNRHGTRCAGEVAADANNSICSVGIAYEAKVGGVRMLDGDVTDAVEARSLSLNPQHIHIYSASWGPDDDGKTVDGPGEFATKAFIDGIQNGRDGLGSIFVWASGNGGRDHDNCNCDGYTNSIWTLSISSATENGLVPWYSEACSSTLATTYSSGSVGEKQVITTDLHHGCTSTHTGTSASAPLAAGICALALQVNSKLTWRDMQHIVVHTAKPGNLKSADWQTNGVGRNVSHSFGYGLMDAIAMVELARNWTTVPPQKMCEAQAPYTNKLIPAKSKVVLILEVNCSEIRYLEHVQAKISLTASRRGDIQIFLKSPLGTRSNLLDTRPHDSSPSGFHSWPFMTVHNWGEHPNGKWMLEIHNEGRYGANINDWNLLLYGTKDHPQHLGKESAAQDFSNNKSVNKDNASTSCKFSAPTGHCIECEDNLHLNNGECVSECPSDHFNATYSINVTNSLLTCLPCHYTCKSCFGSKDFECTSCFADANLENNYCWPIDIMDQMKRIHNFGLYMTVSVVVLALIIVCIVFVLLLRCCSERNANGPTYTELPQTMDNSSTSKIPLDDYATDDSQDEM